MKAVPGAVLVALAETNPPGIEPAWQASHCFDEGMWDCAPATLNGGITTILLTPKKLLPVMLGPWHTSHPLLTPAWLYAELLNLAVFCTGSVRLEPAPTWQLSHAVLPNGMWFVGGATTENPLAGIAKPGAAVALWHCAQFVLVEGALAWIATIVGITAKLLLVWHEVQLDAVATGMWLLGIALAVKSTKLLWQLEHSPLVGCAASTYVKAVSLVLCGRVWKPLNGALVVIGYCDMLIHRLPASWQLEQFPVTPA